MSKSNQKNKNNQPQQHNKQGNIGKQFRNFRQKIRRSVEEVTAGGVVFRRKQDGGIQILMIQDAKDRWTIPKGHVEEGERHEETAAREIEEETGLKHLKVLDRLGKIDFRYRRQDNLILMTTHVFLIHATKDTDNYEPEENEGIKDVQWFDVNDALDLIEYDDIGKLILLGLKKIRDGKY